MYRYNSAGQRLYKKVGAQSAEHYILDGDQTVAVYENGAVKYWNILANGVVGRYEPGSGGKFYYLKDHLGSTRAVVNSSGTVVEAHDYYPFGLLMPGRDYQGGSETKEKFTGKELNWETKLHWFNPGRYYQSAIGRWWVPDLFADVEPSLTPYHYVSNDPIARFDPDGMQDTTVYTVPPVIVEAPRYKPSRYELYYHPSIGGVRYGRGLGAYHNRGLEELGSFADLLHMESDS